MSDKTKEQIQYERGYSDFRAGHTPASLTSYYVDGYSHARREFETGEKIEPPKWPQSKHVTDPDEIYDDEMISMLIGNAS
jgi:hypothetical protein